MFEFEKYSERVLTETILYFLAAYASQTIVAHFLHLQAEGKRVLHSILEMPTFHKKSSILIWPMPSILILLQMKVKNLKLFLNQCFSLPCRITVTPNHVICLIDLKLLLCGDQFFF